MATNLLAQASSGLSTEADVNDLVATLRPRLAGTVDPAEVDRLVREALTDLGPVRVTTYLSILVERRVRQRLRSTPDVEVVDLRQVRATA